MKKTEAQALLADQSEEGAWAHLRRFTEKPDEFIIVVGRFEAMNESPDIEGDDGWVVIAIQNPFGISLGPDGRAQSFGRSHLINATGLYQQNSDAHQGPLGTALAGLWLWDQN